MHWLLRKPLHYKKEDKMKSLHPLAFMIVGGIVTITSHFMTSDDLNYSLFFYIGIIFIAYGTIKWIITGLKETKRHKKERSQKPHKLHLQRDKDVYCYDCKVHMPTNYIFCPFCGRRVQ